MIRSLPDTRYVGDDPSPVMLAVRSGLHKSEDVGASWQAEASHYIALAG